MVKLPPPFLLFVSPVSFLLGSVLQVALLAGPPKMADTSILPKGGSFHPALLGLQQLWSPECCDPL
jgi:hypothetical protein